MQYFDWDPQKNESNLTKHGLDFPTARHIFYDEYAIHNLDTRFEYDEERWITIGMVSSTILVVVYTLIEEENDEHYRIISARKAIKHERELYETHRQST